MNDKQESPYFQAVETLKAQNREATAKRARSLAELEQSSQDIFNYRKVNAPYSSFRRNE